MDYPSELHDRDEDYPLAPETMTIEYVITSKNKHELRAKYFSAAFPFSRKLVCSFKAKGKYVVKSSNLRFNFYRGLKIVKIHRGFRCTANAYFEPYITNNINKRKLCNNDEIVRICYKLINNSVYKKTIENVAKQN